MRFLISYFLIVFAIIIAVVNGQNVRNNAIVAPPLTDFTCGERRFLPIVFGFGGPGPKLSHFRQKRASSNLGFVEATLSNFRKKRASSNLGFALDKLGAHYEPSVVGGHESFANSWPWMALLGTKVRRENVFFCSGILINKRYILTAAHCTGEYDKFFVRLGEHNYIEGTRTAKDFEVSEVRVHPNYRADRGYNDIALIKLSKDVTLTKEIKPVCLPWGLKARESLINKQMIVTGWGTTSFGGHLSGSLQEVRINTFHPSKCQASYSTLRDFRKTFPKGMSSSNVICAGTREGGKDACQGDSGGPIMKEERNGQYTIVGVVSKGYGCGNRDFPGLYAPLGNYRTLDWIKKNAF